MLLIFGCTSCLYLSNGEVLNTEITSTKEKRFELADPRQTGIYFRNDLPESESMNGLFYEYYYNGSGVAVADFNQDGWDDVFMVGTLQKSKLFLNAANGQLNFKEATDQARLDLGKGYNTGATIVDINSDGFPDLYVCRSGRFNDLDKRRNLLFVNKGLKDGIPQFQEESNTYGLDTPSFSTQASFFDYDRDGDLDLFLINHGVDTYASDLIAVYKDTKSQYRGAQLFQNDRGYFKEVTASAGIVNNMLGYGLGVAVGDCNNDGWPDIYVSNDFSGQDHLYINQQNGTFSEQSHQALRHMSNFSMGNDMADYNNDGWNDIITVDMMSEDNFGQKTSMSAMNPENFYFHVNTGLHHQYMYNTLQLNRGDIWDGQQVAFSEVGQMAGVSSTDWSWAPLFVDMDNDGLKDLFISNGIKRDFRNNDYAAFRKKQEKILKSGKVKNKKAFLAELLESMPTKRKPNYFFLNQGNLSFKKLDSAQVPAYPTASNGAAYSDFDHDGDVDLIVNNSDDWAMVYENKQQQLDTKSYLQVRLHGPKSNTQGIGARVVLESGSFQQQDLFLTRGFQSSVSQVLHFGLGDAKEPISLRVEWPNGQVQQERAVALNAIVEIRYNKSAEVSPASNPTKSERQIADITSDSEVNFEHRENDYNDFEREVLLPHKMSGLGPALCAGDVNSDGLEDFFVGGAQGQAGVLHVQSPNGKFKEIKQSCWIKDLAYEDIDATFIDVEGDGDLDLFIVSGGNDNEERYFQDRLYVNDGSGHFSRNVEAIPTNYTSGGTVAAADYDGDGDIDLFVGGRQVPGKYPLPASSQLLVNESQGRALLFADQSADLAPGFSELGMVTNAQWAHLNGDDQMDLVVVGEWMPVTIFTNQGGQLKAATLDQSVGWWSGLMVSDFDQDGDQDLVIGNLGLNAKYKASETEPFEIYADDFDQNGQMDIVLGYHQDGVCFPVRGLQCSSQQIPKIKKEFNSYTKFAQASLDEIYKTDQKKAKFHYQATEFASCYFENKGDGGFMKKHLDPIVQLSMVNAITSMDFNDDGSEDLILAGNHYQTEVETPRLDASYGTILLGNGKGEFQAMSNQVSGLSISGDVKDMCLLDNGLHTKLVVARNNDAISVFKMKNNRNHLIANR